MENQKITLGFSPCPNDTFIFDAMVHYKIDTEGLEFEVFMGDVEELNQKAFRSELDITKLSYHAFAHLINDYQLLNSGSAIGQNCGPLLISKRPQLNARNSEIQVAIPGKYTTANFLLSLAYPEITNKVELIFSDIEQAVIDGNVDAGLIIHENRFTYQDKGLIKIKDLGEFWEEIFSAPIPLGGIVVKRSIEPELQQKIDRVLKRSVQFAFENPESSSDYVSQNAQEMKLEVAKQHIELYVNDYSVDLGKKGREAVEILVNKAVDLKIIPSITNDIFVENRI
ncbi:MAG: 1,4-dihydroxy-6-naphthoate synthase [Flavobacteriales bacterium]|nr:1,4-dihydroxy-6-naphthoate synthase [Flavobacteriales bacterium]